MSDQQAKPSKIAIILKKPWVIKLLVLIVLILILTMENVKSTTFKPFIGEMIPTQIAYIYTPIVALVGYLVGYLSGRRTRNTTSADK